MKDMKLVTLMAINKPEPKKLNEIKNVSVEKDGVLVSIDDYDDVTFKPGRNVANLPELGVIVDGMSKTRWFTKLVVAIAKRQVREIKVDLSDAGVMFRNAS